jgi:hypothetical protein
MLSREVWYRVGVVTIDVWEEYVASIFRVEGISELGALSAIYFLAVSNRFKCHEI